MYNKSLMQRMLLLLYLWLIIVSRLCSSALSYILFSTTISNNWNCKAETDWQNIYHGELLLINVDRLVEKYPMWSRPCVVYSAVPSTRVYLHHIVLLLLYSCSFHPADVLMVMPATATRLLPSQDHHKLQTERLASVHLATYPSLLLERDEKTENEWLE